MCILSTVTGEYVVEVRTHGYNNPRNLLADGSCCDINSTWPWPTCAVPGCDNVFYYCLRSLGSSNLREDCDGRRMISEINFNDSQLNFSNDTVLGLLNPLPLPGLTRVWSVSSIT